MGTRTEPQEGTRGSHTTAQCLCCASHGFGRSFTWAGEKLCWRHGQETLLCLRSHPTNVWGQEESCGLVPDFQALVPPLMMRFN